MRGTTKRVMADGAEDIHRLFNYIRRSHARRSQWSYMADNRPHVRTTMWEFGGFSGKLSCTCVDFAVIEILSDASLDVS